LNRHSGYALPILPLKDEQSFIALQQLETKTAFGSRSRPPVRFQALLGLNELSHKLLVTVHHIIFDGESGIAVL
jgi:NRPS condensation-like uncharacterized protein